MTILNDLTKFLDEEFQVKNFEFDKVINGLNVQNSGKVEKIGIAVDISIESICEAKKHNVDLLLVHHGPFLRNINFNIIDKNYEKIKTMIENDIALYSLHLPLDTHKEFAHSIVMFEKLNWSVNGTFGNYSGIDVGFYTDFIEAVNIEDIIEKIKSEINKNIKVWGFGDFLVRRVGMISGNGITLLKDAKEHNIDLLITGEASHSFYWQAYEMGIKCIFAGHYNTEKFGLIKLAEYIKENFNIEYVFIDLPTGE